MKPEDPARATDMPFLEERQLTEEQRSAAVKALLDQGFSVADIWNLAPSLLVDRPESAQTISLPIV